MKATVLVRPKAGILDPQGATVEGSLRKLGFEMALPDALRSQERNCAPACE